MVLLSHIHTKLENLNCDRKKKLTTLRILVQPMHGVALEKAFDYWVAFLQMSLIWFLKVSLLSNCVPNNFLYLLFFINSLLLLRLIIRQCYN